MKMFRGNTSWLAMFGAGFFWAWLDCTITLPTLYEPFGTSGWLDTAYLLTYALSIVPSALALLLPIVADRLTSKPLWGPLIGGIGALGCAAIMAGGALATPPLLLSGVALSGIALGALLVTWGRVCVAQGSTHALIHITGAYAVSFVVDLIAIFLQPVPAAVFLALCPLISGALLLILVAYTPDGKELELGSAPTFNELGSDVSPGADVRFDARLVVIITAFYCVLGFAGFVNNPSSSLSVESFFYAVSWEIVGVVLFVACAFFGWRAKNVSVFSLAMIACAAVALILPLSNSAVHGISGSFMVASCSGFDVLVWLLVALNHHFTLRPYVGTVAIVALCQQAGSLLGYACSVLFPAVRTDMDAYLAAAFALCVVLAFGILYIRHSSKTLIRALFNDESMDDLPGGTVHPALPGGATLSYVPSTAEIEAAARESERFGGHAARATTPAEQPTAATAHATRASEPAVEPSAHTAQPAAREARGTTRTSEAREARTTGANTTNAARATTAHKAPSTPAAASAPTPAETSASSATAALERIADEYRLTRREREVFAHLAKGRSAPYIAELYQVSENTVRSHIKHIYTKLDVHSRQELLSFVRDNGAA